MALFHSHFFSETLGMQTGATVIVPQPASDRQIGVKKIPSKVQWPCLWLLHGLSDDHTIWTRRTSIERYAEAAGCAVVMPDAHRSFYTDMANGGEYWRFLSEELPGLMRSFFPLSDRKQDNAVAGLSMGGYGALKWLLRKPGMFMAGASLSGALDLVALHERALKEPPESSYRRTLTRVFGLASPVDTEEDLFYLMRQRISPDTCPPMWIGCGREDGLFAHHQRFESEATSLKLPLTALETDGGHTWELWDVYIQFVLTWLAEQGFGRSSRIDTRLNA